MSGIQFGLQPRNETIGKLIQDCVDGKLPFSGPNSLCAKIAAMGYKTTSLYEMVRAAEEICHTSAETPAKTDQERAKPPHKSMRTDANE